MPIPAPKPVPEGMNTLTTHLWFSGRCGQAVEFYQKALGAELAGPVVPYPDGQGVMHAMLKLGNSHFMLADAAPGGWEKGPETYATAGLFAYVEDCDALFQRATAALRVAPARPDPAPGRARVDLGAPPRQQRPSRPL